MVTVNTTVEHSSFGLYVEKSSSSISKRSTIDYPRDSANPDYISSQSKLELCTSLTSKKNIVRGSDLSNEGSSEHQNSCTKRREI